MDVIARLDRATVSGALMIKGKLHSVRRHPESLPRT
jgi:hypothetical protein